MPIGAAMLDKKAVDYLEFGTGDIGLGTVKLATANGEEKTLFAFATRKPAEIGFVPDKKDRPGIEDIELIFRFTKLESLDVLIGALKEHKKILKKEKEVI